MEFFIKKNATLPLLLVKINKDGRSDYRRLMEDLTASTITFSMIEVDTKIPKILNKECSIRYNTTTEEYYISYQFTNKNTRIVGRYSGQLSIVDSSGTLLLPLVENLFINIVDSFALDNISYSGSSATTIENNCCDGGNSITNYILTENGLVLITEDGNNITHS